MRAILSAGLFVLFAVLSIQNVSAQCEEGEVEISMNIYTDAWGYEIYWEVYPEGSTCGEGTVISGGNLDQVGCTGSGEQDATGGNGYPNNSVIEVEGFCVPIGEPLTLQFIDDWGDGGATFELFYDGQLVGFYVGQGGATSWTFNPGVTNIPLYDEPCNAEEVTVDGAVVVMDNTDAIASLNEVTPGGGNCALQGIWCEGGVSNSVWASFVAPESGSVYVSTCTEETLFDTQIALWSGDDCGDQTTFELISANDDILGGCGPGAFFASGMFAGCLNPGETYYIQVDGWNGAVGQVGVEVTSSDAEVELLAFVNDNPCPVDKGEDGSGSILPYFVGYGSNYDALWSGPGNFTSSEPFVTGLDAGEYTVTIITECGDIFEESWTISNPDPLSIALSIDAPDCPLSFNGTALPTVNGGTGGYTYEWFGPDDYTFEGAEPTDLGEGEYELVVTDGNGCTITQTINLESTNEIDLDLGPDLTICLEETEVVFGPVGYDYLWQDGSNNQFFEINGEELGEGTFSFILNVSNEEGCDATDAVQVTVENCSSVGENAFNDLSVFPIPAQDVLNIANAESDMTFELLDTEGRIVTQGALNGKGTIDVQPFSRGIYVLRLMTNGQLAIVRVQLQ
ncbi:T9SS type A sorting domain-containing protein [Sanyastnella coralliicola]|uniref:T9SS type A sorting domain-containing protein n=1 Tax=Sanyastnella coralliicola TaxID=3069118 RepID=UPI0027B94573|nr:T9SS type A sorting domain-containing protein [Longitalea sp. SCSIO 12813]